MWVYNLIALTYCWHIYRFVDTFTEHSWPLSFCRNVDVHRVPLKDWQTWPQSCMFSVTWAKKCLKKKPHRSLRRLRCSESVGIFKCSLQKFAKRLLLRQKHLSCSVRHVYQPQWPPAQPLLFQEKQLCWASGSLQATVRTLVVQVISTRTFFFNTEFKGPVQFVCGVHWRARGTQSS